ncbi:MAG: pRiA4b ORF-3-like protein [Paenibacillus sp.]|jgi:hypothetical protein|nr:pRiA4b ORF-3-like protein [Paenibacillus sp.]
MAAKNEGVCLYCDGRFGKAAIARHLNHCTSRLEDKSSGFGPGDQSFFVLSVQGFAPYWMYVDIDADAKLIDLDSFLRNKWLECCGHLSGFSVDDNTYSVSPDKFMGDKSMNVKIDKVLEVGMSFRHDYDYGSTTTLKLKVVSARKGIKRRGPDTKVQLMAENIAPVFQCSYCNNKAEHICCECVYEDEGYLCDACAMDHECGEDMQLPILNSPRSGVCGYCG